MNQKNISLELFIDRLNRVMENLTNELNALDFQSSGVDSFQLKITQNRNGEKNIEVQLTPIEKSDE